MRYSKASARGALAGRCDKSSYPLTPRAEPLSSAVPRPAWPGEGRAPDRSGTSKWETNYAWDTQRKVSFFFFLIKLALTQNKGIDGWDLERRKPLSSAGLGPAGVPLPRPSCSPPRAALPQALLGPEDRSSPTRRCQAEQHRQHGQPSPGNPPVPSPVAGAPARCTDRWVSLCLSPSGLVWHNALRQGHRGHRAPRGPQAHADTRTQTHGHSRAHSCKQQDWAPCARVLRGPGVPLPSAAAPRRVPLPESVRADVFAGLGSGRARTGFP